MFKVYFFNILKVCCLNFETSCIYFEEKSIEESADISLHLFNYLVSKLYFYNHMKTLKTFFKKITVRIKLINTVINMPINTFASQHLLLEEK